jgi:hypothetical protein
LIRATHLLFTNYWLPRAVPNVMTSPCLRNSNGVLMTLTNQLFPCPVLHTGGCLIGHSRPYNHTALLSLYLGSTPFSFSSYHCLLLFMSHHPSLFMYCVLFLGRLPATCRQWPTRHIPPPVFLEYNSKPAHRLTRYVGTHFSAPILVDPRLPHCITTPTWLAGALVQGVAGLLRARTIVFPNCTQMSR